jgi:tetratricopeptide (TPR) repeat protein
MFRSCQEADDIGGQHVAGDGSNDEFFAKMASAYQKLPGKTAEQHLVATNFALGQQYQQGNNYSDAALAFQEGDSLRRLDADAHLALGIALYKKKDIDQALDNLCKAVDIDATNANTWFNLGVVCFDLLDAEGTPPFPPIECFNNAIKLAPEPDKSAWNNLGLAKLREKDYQGAITALQEALKLDKASGGPQDARLPNNLGIAYSQAAASLREEAVVNLRDARKLNPSISLGALHLFVPAVAEGTSEGFVPDGDAYWMGGDGGQLRPMGQTSSPMRSRAASGGAQFGGAQFGGEDVERTFAA